MKLITTFALLFAGTFALPQDEVGQYVEPRLTVTNRIQRAVNELNQQIRERGLDPLIVTDRFLNVNTLLGGVHAHLKGLKCSGLAQNRFTWLRFNAITMRLNFELEWPRIACELKSLGVEVALLGRLLEASGSGVLEMSGTSIGGIIRVRARPISGVSITECSLNINTTIRSNQEVTWQGCDISYKMDVWVEALNRIVQEYKDAVGRQLCELLEQVM